MPFFRKAATYGMPMRFPRFVPGARALDIGCGNGFYLSYLKRHGWEVEGVDISEAAAQMAKKTFQIPVHVGEFDSQNLPVRSYDWIHMSHVLEHLPNPVASLARVFALLKPGGGLYVETPNASSFSRRLCGPFWFAWDAPRHLHLFSPSTLRGALNRAGFIVDTMRSTVSPDIFIWEDTYRSEEKIGRFIAPRPALSKRAAPRAYALRALTRIAAIVRPLSGDTLACVAQRPARE
jgi:SAM-dependent methyltransferase